MNVKIKTAEELVGSRVPSVVFRTRQDDKWADVSSDDLFKGKTVVVFALPGAFTPTCSASHLPRYNELAPAFFERGVDDIVCVSVNDAFVMNAWLADQDAQNIIAAPDGNGDFTRGMGMLVPKRELGFGERSWRYSMLVSDGIVQKAFVEPLKSGDPFEVSDAETMLKAIDPDWREQASVAVICKPDCHFCGKAKAFLKAKGMAYEEIMLGRDISMAGVRALCGNTQLPQIFIGGRHIGGSKELGAYVVGRSA